MHIDDALLSRISAQFSAYNYITFSSVQGSIEVHHVLHYNDMQKSQTARIKLISAGNVTFLNGASAFHTLEVQSGNGIFQRNFFSVVISKFKNLFKKHFFHRLTGI